MKLGICVKQGKTFFKYKLFEALKDFSNYIYHYLFLKDIPVKLEVLLTN